jgi:hypothetical protein
MHGLGRYKRLESSHPITQLTEASNRFFPNTAQTNHLMHDPHSRLATVNRAGTHGSKHQADGIKQPLVPQHSATV